MPFCLKFSHARVSARKSWHRATRHSSLVNQDATLIRSRLTAHLRALVGERHPLSSPAHLHQAERYLCDQFSEAGLAVTTHDFEAMGGIYHNVIGMVSPASIQEEEDPLPFILAAHYDTISDSPGADDNASALAVLLEVAHRVRFHQLGRPIRFIAFSLEEEGLLGSCAYASHLAATRQSIHGAVVLECVGYAREEEGSQRIPPGVPIAVPTVGNFLAVIGNQTSAAFTAAVSQAMISHVPVVPLVVPGNGELLPDTRRSDHTAFWEQGFPAVMLTDTANFRNPNYHRSTDTIETLNLDFMEAVADGVTAVVIDLAG
jgi:aminopeptidase YwaD